MAYELWTTLSLNIHGKRNRDEVVIVYKDLNICRWGIQYRTRACEFGEEAGDDRNVLIYVNPILKRVDDVHGSNPQ